MLIRDFTKLRQNWSVTDRELYAIYYLCKRLFSFLGNSQKINIYIDHKPLTFMIGGKHRLPSNKIARWVLFITFLNVEVKYQRGKENHLADLLSRQVNKVSLIQKSSNETVKELQEVDFWTGPIIDYLKKDKLPKDEKEAQVVLFISLPPFPVFSLC